MSVWCIGGHHLFSGEPAMADAIAEGMVGGLVSTPRAVAAAVGWSDRYEDLRPVHPVPDPLEAIEVTAARGCADLLSSLHRLTFGEDGFVTVPVSPILAGDAIATVAAAARLWAELDRANGLIGLAGTPALLDAVTVAAAQGIPANVRALCSPGQVLRAARAYLSGAAHRERADRLTCVLTIEPAPLEADIARRLAWLGESPELARGLAEALTVVAADRLSRLRRPDDVHIVLAVSDEEGGLVETWTTPEHDEVLRAGVRLAGVRQVGIDIEDTAEAVAAELVAAEVDAYSMALEVATFADRAVWEHL